MPGIQKISVDLTAEQLVAMRQAVDAGEYASTGEVVRDAIQDWRLRRAEAKRLGTLWDEGKASGAVGRFDIEGTLARAKARLSKTSAV